MSSANAFLRVSSVIALPPYFTTITLPWYFSSHGSAPASVAALSCAACRARAEACCSSEVWGEAEDVHSSGVS